MSLLPPVVLVDLSTAPGDHESGDRIRLTDLDHLPDGARVVVNVGSRAHVAPDAVHLLRLHRDRLKVQVEGSAQAAGQWHRSLAVRDDKALPQ